MNLTLILIIPGLTLLFSEDKYIKVMRERVNIRYENNLKSIIIAKARKSDIFKLTSEKGDWYEITVFSGDYRYIYRSLAKIILYLPSLPKSESTRRAVFLELVEAKNQVIIDTNKKLPTSIYNKIDYSRILEDRYKLEIFHRYNIQPPTYWQLIAEGERKGWDKRRTNLRICSNCGRKIEWETRINN